MKWAGSWLIGGVAPLLVTSESERQEVATSCVFNGVNNCDYNGWLSPGVTLLFKSYVWVVYCAATSE